MPSMSNGLTVTVQSPMSSCAPAFSDSTTTPSCSLTNGASFATRFMPSKIGFTSSTSNCLYAATACVEVVADAEVDRLPAVGAEALVERARLALDRDQVLGVRREVLPRRVHQREHPDPPGELGIPLEQQRERAKAADDVLRGIGAVDADDQHLGPRLHDLPLLLEHRRVLLQRLELVGVDPDRARDDVRAAAVVDEALALRIPLGARDRHARLDEVAAPAVACGSRRRRSRAVPRARRARTSSGSTCQKSACAHGMWMNCSRRASGRASRTWPGAR